MSNEETETQTEEVRRVEPMTEDVRAAHYFAQKPHRREPTGPQRRRLKHKANHSIAQEVRAAEEKVSKLRGAAKKSAQKTLDKLREKFV